MTEEQAISRLKEFMENDKYILLSTVKANMILGFSVPYVGEVEQGKLIVMFDSLDYAKEYIEKMGFEVLDGVYPVAKIDDNNKAISAQNILNIALKMGITHLDINPAHSERELGVDIRWLAHVLNMDTEEIQVLISQKEKEELESDSNHQVELRFNGMPIYDYINPFVISEERKQEIAKIPILHAKTQAEYVESIQNMPINELCHLSEVILRRYIPHAKAQKKEDDEKFFNGLFNILDQVIIHQAIRLPLMTLLDGEDLFINKGQAAYLMYTDRFKYMGEYRHEDVDIREFLDKLDNMDINYIFITCGPYDMHLTTVDAFREYISNNYL